MTHLPLTVNSALWDIITSPLFGIPLRRQQSQSLSKYGKLVNTNTNQTQAACITAVLSLPILSLSPPPLLPSSLILLSLPLSISNRSWIFMRLLFALLAAERGWVHKGDSHQPRDSAGVCVLWGCACVRARKIEVVAEEMKMRKV